MCTGDVETIATDIVGYLQENPNAADTLAGVTRWWWQRRQYERERDYVLAALDKLAAEGIVGIRRSADGEALYFLNRPAGAE